MEFPASGFCPQSCFPTKASMHGELLKADSSAYSNHFQVRLASSASTFFEWHMGFVRREDLDRFLSEPELVPADAVAPDSRFLIAEVLKANRAQLAAKLGRTFPTGVTLYSLKDTPGQSERFLCDGHPRFVLVLSKKNAAMDLGALAASPATRPQFLRFLNSAVKGRFSQMDFIELGRNKKYYNPAKAVRVRSGGFDFLVLRGFKTAFDVYEGGLRLLVDYSTRVIRERSLWEEVLGLRQQNQPDEDIVESLVKGRSVLTMYGSQRIYRVDEVLTNGRPGDAFPDPKFASFADYFTKRYKVQLRHKDQWLLVHLKTIVDRDAGGKEVGRRQERIVLLPELVRATGLTDEMRGDFRLMKDLGQHTILGPDSRFGEVEEIIRDLNRAKSDGLEFKIDERAGKIKALRFPAPRILSGKDGGQAQVPSSDRIQLSEPAQNKPIKDWLLVFEPFVRKDIDLVLDNFHSACGRYRIKFEDPSDFLELDHRDRAQDLEAKIRRSKEPDPSLIFFFVSRKAAGAIYKDMKRFFNAKGIVTQFFVSFNPNKDAKGLAKFGNLLLQMVNKLGGNLWLVDRVLKDCLVLGADTCRAKGGRAVVGVTGQFDERFSRSYSLARLQPAEGPLIMRSVAAMVLEQVDYFAHKMKRPPKTLLFYRDGVGQGQFAEVLAAEVKAIEQRLAESYGQQKPGLVFVVVTKRIDDRFAVSFDGRLRNPDAGLVVLDEVVPPGHANFFMVAQKVTQGTANPTHYDVLYNGAGIGLRELVAITHELTWGYSNWLGPVKVPAPVQYAKKLCGLIGVTQDPEFSSNLKSTRFYM